MKKWIRACILIVILILGIITWILCRDYYPTVEKVHYFVQNEEKQSYCLVQADDSDYICSMKKSGKIKAALKLQSIDEFKGARIKAMAAGTDAVYALAEDRGGRSYSILKVSQSGKLEQVYECPDFQAERSGGLFADGENIYLTMLFENRQLAVAFQMDLSQAEQKSFQAVNQKQAKENRYIVAADYDGSEFKMAYDNDDSSKADEILGYQTPVLKNNISNMFFLARGRMILVAIAAAALLAAGTLFFSLIFKSRSYGLQRFAAAEAVLLIVIVLSILISFVAIVKSAQVEKLDAAEYLLNPLIERTAVFTDYDTLKEGYEDTEDYRECHQVLTDFMNDRKMATYFESVCLVDEDDGRYTRIVSSDTCTGYELGAAYSVEMLKIVEKSKELAASCHGFASINGRQFGVCVLKYDIEMIPGKFLVGFVPVAISEAKETGYLARLGVGCLILLVVGTFLLAVLTVLENREIRKFSLTMEWVCKGQQREFDKPERMSWDMARMWNSLYEIYKDREKIFYSRNRIFKDYYRYAPRNIEKILGKESISDVNVGDVVKVKGTAALLSMEELLEKDQKLYMEKMNRNFDIICKYQTAYDGVLLSSDCNLNSLKALFVDEIDNAAKFGIETLLALDDAKVLLRQKITIFLHATNLMYGVAGTKEQSFPFAVSMELDDLKPYADGLREMGVKMVMTETVARDCHLKMDTRYIGYVELKRTGMSIKLYEILDAYAINEKKKMIIMMQNFSQGLELYYKNDFYLARSKFTDVVKECPYDNIAKWYLFTCEKMLNQKDFQEFKYGLLADLEN